MQQSGNQGGLAAVRMPHYSYVADLTSLVRFHGVLLGASIVLDKKNAGPPQASVPHPCGGTLSHGRETTDLMCLHL
jgi:hypothetical protein